jgi:hypothetical protein
MIFLCQLDKRPFFVYKTAAIAFATWAIFFVFKDATQIRPVPTA